LYYGDLTDTANLVRIIQQVQPDEIYNLESQSHVQVSFEAPEIYDGYGRAGDIADFGNCPHSALKRKRAFIRGGFCCAGGFASQTGKLPYPIEPL
jgi:hypothetical protein